MTYSDGYVYEEIGKMAFKKEKVKKKFNGTIYKGEFKNNQRHGKGTMKMEDGFSYTGDWISGEMSGRSIVVYANGDQYDGYFLNGKREGKGVMTFGMEGLLMQFGKLVKRSKRW